MMPRHLDGISHATMALTDTDNLRRASDAVPMAAKKSR